MSSDFRHALRSLTKQPGFAAMAVLTLALGIGTTTAIFSAVHGVLIRPLPFADEDRLVIVAASDVRHGWDERALSYPNFADLRDRNRTLVSMGAWASYRNTKAVLTGGDAPEELQYALATASFYETLGATAVAGRLFRPEEDAEGTAPVAILSHGVWRRRFGGDADVVGSAVVLDGRPHTVIGVLPAEFAFATFPAQADVWLPFGLDPVPGRRWSRGTNYLLAVGKLRDGVAPDEALADLARVAAELEREYPDRNAGAGVRVTPLREKVAGELRPALLVLLAGVGFVLLIACVNVANLMLTRVAGRERDIAVHVALGASRWRVARRVLAECALLAGAGVVSGVLLAAWLLDAFAVAQYAASDPFVPYRLTNAQIGLDGAVLGFAVGLSVVTVIVCGLLPAVRGSRPHLGHALQAAGGRATGPRSEGRLRHALVVAEVALAMVLVVGAGLLGRSFIALRRVDPGFEPGHVLTAEINLARDRYGNPSRRGAFADALLQRVRALPGVTAAGAIDALPLSGAEQSSDFFIESAAPDDGFETHQRTVTPGYFEAMRIPVLRGRGVVAGDDASGRRVAVVSETMARRFWPGEDALGKRVGLGLEAFVGFDPRTGPQWDSTAALREIVGVVGDIKHAGPTAAGLPMLYLPHAQRPTREITVAIRASGDPTALVRAVREAVHALDPDQPIAAVRTLESLAGGAVARPRANSLLLGGFGLLAMLLAAVGVFGVVSFTVAQRTREVGVRMALGGTRGAILRLLMSQGARVVLLGVAIGAAGALLVNRFLARLLFGVGPTDPLSLIAGAVLLSTAALLATYLPARRASRVSPTAALRYE